MASDGLVEKAAKAGAVARRGVAAHVNDVDREVAVAVLAVFEQAQAETIATALEEAADDLEAPSPANLFKWAGPARSWLRTRAAQIRQETTA